MAATPKHRRSKSSSGERRMHLGLIKPNLSVCPNCKKKIEPHTVCQFCGYYNGKKVI